MNVGRRVWPIWKPRAQSGCSPPPQMVRVRRFEEVARFREDDSPFDPSRSRTDGIPRFARTKGSPVPNDAGRNGGRGDAPGCRAGVNEPVERVAIRKQPEVAREILSPAQIRSEKTRPPTQKAAQTLSKPVAGTEFRTLRSPNRRPVPYRRRRDVLLRRVEVPDATGVRACGVGFFSWRRVVRLPGVRRTFRRPARRTQRQRDSWNFPSEAPRVFSLRRRLRIPLLRVRSTKGLEPGAAWAPCLDRVESPAADATPDRPFPAAG